MKVKDLIAMLDVLNPNDDIVLDLQDEVPNDLYDFYIDAIPVAKSSLEIRLVPRAYSRLVAIYYNDVFVSEQPFEIYEDCPYVHVPIDKAEAYAAAKLENGDWQSYCIPELVRDHKVKFL